MWLIMLTAFSVMANTWFSTSDTFAISVGDGEFEAIGSCAGFQEQASGPRCHLPGQCCILNRYRNVFSLNLHILGLDMLFRSRSLKIPSKGLWSVTIRRLEQPRI